MKQYTPTYTEISNWQISVYQNTGGTRAKKIAIHSATEEEYFCKITRQSSFSISNRNNLDFKKVIDR